MKKIPESVLDALRYQATPAGIRRIGFGMMVGPSAFAAFVDGWQGCFLVGCLLLGLGIGLEGISKGGE